MSLQPGINPLEASSMEEDRKLVENYGVRNQHRSMLK